MDDESFRKILNHFNLSWKGYRKVRKGVKKRLDRHMRQLGCSRVEDYLDLLSRQPELERQCRLHLTVSISRFFRDRSLWEILHRQILPDMTAGRQTVFRVWSCGCARGEEAYSFAILWDRLKSLQPDVPQTRIWATDLHPQYLAMAKRGVYGRSSLKEMRRDRIQRDFDKVPGKERYRVKPFLQQAVRFERLDIIRASPPSNAFELVFARNHVLTYYRPPEKERALEKIVGSLVPGGLLVIGAHEKIPDHFGCLQPCRAYPWLFFKCREPG